MYKLSIVNEDRPIDDLYIPESLVCDPVMHIWLVKEVYEAFYEMNRALQREGLPSIYGRRGYLCFAYQKKLFQNEVQKNIRQGLKAELAYEKARRTLMPPGCSEHQLGLCIDIALHHMQQDNSISIYEESPQFHWMREYATSYGFILRYPKDKMFYTKFSYRPWHYRYVGIGHAKKMAKLGLCLEEYYEAFYKE